jgi:hypothetical protein
MNLLEMLEYRKRIKKDLFNSLTGQSLHLTHGLETFQPLNCTAIAPIPLCSRLTIQYAAFLQDHGFCQFFCLARCQMGHQARAPLERRRTLRALLRRRDYLAALSIIDAIFVLLDEARGFARDFYYVKLFSRSTKSSYFIQVS